MKHLFFCLAFSLCFISAKAQNITTDTLKANALYKQAEDLLNRSRYDSALLLYRQTLPLYEKHKLWREYYNSGKEEVICLIQLNKLDSASSLGEHYLKSAEQNLPEFSEAKAALGNNVGISYYYQSQYKETLEHWQKSLSIKLELLGEKHTNVARAYNNLGFLYRELRKYDSAAYYHRKAVKASAKGFESNQLSQNPKPEQALEKNVLMKYLRTKAEAIVLFKKRKRCTAKLCSRFSLCGAGHARG